jgi:hypothetical protein
MARDLHIQRREEDLVVGTFGRGAFILDDYSPLRVLTTETLSGPAALLPLRLAYQYNQLNQQRAVWGNTTTPNPPYGAVFTYFVGQPPAGDAKLAITIADDTGKQVRRIEVPKQMGIQRAAWNLNTDPPPQTEQQNQQGRGAAQAGRGGGRGFGRGGPPQGPPVAPGRYRATLGTLAGETFTPIGEPQTFMVVPLSR